MTSHHRLLLLGATGETGKQALAAALSDPRVSHVLTFGRRAPTLDSATPSSKLTHSSLDFDALLKEGAAGGPETTKLRDAEADSVLIALGTTRASAGSAEAFERIDREYVLSAARAARREDKPDQRVVYVSSTSANSSAWFLYPRSKGLTEEGLASLGYASTTIFRPGLLVAPGGRGEHRFAESLAVKTIPHLPFGKSTLWIGTDTLGRSLVNAAVGSPAVKEYAKEEILKDQHKVWAVSNADALKLADAGR
ncbi:hypothetical protein JCM10296v2_006408 [Rhodotorula toruloides]